MPDSQQWGSDYIKDSTIVTGDVAADTLTAADIAASAFTSSTWEFWDMPNLVVSTAAMPLLTRNAAGDWSWNRTATAAETLYFAAIVPIHRSVAGQGWRLDKVRIPYELGVVAATSVDVTATSTAYVQGVDPAVTAAHGGAVVNADYDTAHDTAAERADNAVVAGEHMLVLTLNTAAYFVTVNAYVVVEGTFVLANTGTLKVRGIGLEYTQLAEGT